MSRPLAAAVLSDARPSPVALYIIPPGADQDYTQALDTLVAESPSPLGSGLPGRARCRLFRSGSASRTLARKKVAGGARRWVKAAASEIGWFCRGGH